MFENNSYNLIIDNQKVAHSGSYKEILDKYNDMYLYLSNQGYSVKSSFTNKNGESIAVLDKFTNCVILVMQLA